MNEIEALTDDELLAIQNGDPLLGKLTPIEARRRTMLQTNRPMGDARTRQDTNIIGVDHAAIQQRIANWASTLPRQFQRPAAMLATLPADMMASLAEMFSVPEAVGPSAPMRAGADLLARSMSAPVRQIPNMAIRGTAAVGDVIAPDLLGAISPRAGKIVELAQRVRTKLDTPATASAVSPAEIPSGAPPVAVPPVSALPAPTPSALRLTAEESQALRQLVDQGYDEAEVVKAIAQQRQSAPSAAASAPAPPSGKPTLAAAETKEYQRLLQRGKSPREAMDLIVAQRAFQQQKRLPTSEQTRQSVYDRNETGRWPE